MPKEHKKRGRRAEKQQRAQIDHDEDGDRPVKRRRTEEPEQEFAVNGEAGDDYISFAQQDYDPQDNQVQTTFYGLLTEDEQAYYTNVNNKITANDFENEEDRANFIEAVYRETAGKEIKIASSQSCSRHLERLVKLSTPNQLRTLFLAFLQDLEYLVQHRFGSHCCETLFTQCAQFVEPDSKHTEDGDTSFETLFLETAEKLEPNVGFLLTERFASHTLRVLLLVLSGQPLEDANTQEMLASRKKEKIELSQSAQTQSPETRKVPKSFKIAQRKLIGTAVAGLDATYVRALATSPTGNPMLQLLVQIELSDSDHKPDANRSIVAKLIPDLNFEVESDSSKFVSSLLYDTTGAYLLQELVRRLPGKVFKKLYKNLFRDRIGKIAKNEIASYVAMSIFERVGKEDLAHAVDAILPEVPGLVERNRLAPIRTLVERCALRNVDLTCLRDALLLAYGDNSTTFVTKMLKVEISEAEDTTKSTSEPRSKPRADVQGSLLAQAMLRAQDMCGTVHNSLLRQERRVLDFMAKDPVSSRVLQVALKAEQSSGKFHRQFVPLLFNQIPDLALDVSGSHVVDALWDATSDSHFLKEEVAKILLRNEARLRDSMYGRTVWRNWAMDTYQRRPRDWKALAKGQTEAQLGEEQPSRQKSAIELARERFVQKQAKRGKQNVNITTIKAGA